jgi:hypothetical protein
MATDENDEWFSGDTGLTDDEREFMLHCVCPLASSGGRLAFGELPGVTIHDVTSMSPEAISGVLQRPGTIIGGFCDSTACLGAFR